MNFISLKTGIRNNLPKNKKIRAITRYYWQKIRQVIKIWSKLTSLGYIEGMYSKYPRIDKELIHKYHEGLIATTCCLGALVPQTILKKGEAEAENEFKWWLNIFQKDYYVELQRHGIPDQEKVNKVLIKICKKI